MQDLCLGLMAGPCVTNQNVIGVGSFSVVSSGLWLDPWPKQKYTKICPFHVFSFQPQVWFLPHSPKHFQEKESDKASQSQKEPLWHELIRCWLHNISTAAGESAGGDRSHMAYHVLRKLVGSSFMPCPLQIHRIFSRKIGETISETHYVYSTWDQGVNH